MWFEILPAFGIITVALAIPGFAIYHIQDLWTGNVSEKRNQSEFYVTLKIVNIFNNIVTVAMDS